MGWRGRASDVPVVTPGGRGYRGGRETAAGAGASGWEHGVTPPRSCLNEMGGMGLMYTLAYALEVGTNKSPYQPSYNLPFHLSHSVSLPDGDSQSLTLIPQRATPGG